MNDDAALDFPARLRALADAADWQCQKDFGAFRQGCKDCETNSSWHQGGRRGLQRLGFLADRSGIALARAFADAVEALEFCREHHYCNCGSEPCRGTTSDALASVAKIEEGLTP